MEIIAASLLFAIAVTAWILSIRSFLEKGFLLNNAYLYASKKERETMNKKPYYRQSGVMFLLVGFVFLLNGLEAILKTERLPYAAIALLILTVFYAIVSSVRIEKKK